MAKKKSTKNIPEIFKKEPASNAGGAVIIEAYLRTLDSTPGVYRMINSSGDVLYVGKAKNLTKRVTNYTSLNNLFAT